MSTVINSTFFLDGTLTVLLFAVTFLCGVQDAGKKIGVTVEGLVLRRDKLRCRPLYFQN